ncbi:hypothetical protein ACFL6L_03515 [candidate division KSB1 bacterium]
MAVVEYCDNVNCAFNKKFRCTAADVDFDDDATCLTASYNDETGPHKEKSSDSGEPGTDRPAVDRQSKDKWLKYI